ncbi:hypothetical protein [Chitinophaga varians]|uniref:hypothetical protein n=1 Tax=Chitinophaga varians TaxID=2202339 RepID=UPI001660030C|nr:hypothetical protein [Chitinophaga varians]MBC9908915.1 hypothetical protein [Chitinophaga varians]
MKTVLLSLLLAMGLNSTPPKLIKEEKGPDRIVTMFNLSIGLNVTSHELYVSWQLQPGNAASYSTQASWGPYTKYFNLAPQGNITFYGAIVQPNTVQTMTFDNGRVKFIWDGTGTACTVICQPGPTTGCPDLPFP